MWRGGNVIVGQAFEEVEGRVHRAKNLGTEEVVVYNTFIVPEGDPTTVNTPNNERQCGPPRKRQRMQGLRLDELYSPEQFQQSG